MPAKKTTTPPFTFTAPRQYAIEFRGRSINVNEPIGNRRCTKCGESKPIDRFSPRKNGKFEKFMPYCKPCMNAKNYAWQKANPGRHSDARWRYEYGLERGEYRQRLEAQGGKCFICGDAPQRLDLDHDHATLAIRAFLCRQCNLAIGHAGDNPLLCERIAAYLRQFGAPDRDPLR